MHKRGALFYIIDAFVAAGIIAVTMTIIFSSQLNTPREEAAEDALDAYTDYLQGTSIFEAPGTHKETIIQQGLVDDRNDSVTETLAQLIIRQREDLAQALMDELAIFALEPQYGANVTLTMEGITTQLLLRHEERQPQASVLLRKHLIGAYQTEDTYETYNTTITGTGTNACSPDRCIYVYDDEGTYYPGECLGTHNKDQAACHRHNESELYLYTLEVSIWP